MQLEFKDYTQKPCKGSAAIEFIPKKNKRIDLERTFAVLMDCSEISIEAQMPRMLLLKCNSCTVSFFGSGKVLVRNAKNDKQAKTAIKTLLKCIAKV